MKKIFSLMSLLALALTITACGSDSKKIVSGVVVETRDQNEQKYVVADFEMALGEAELPFLHLPLPNEYGYLRMYRSNGINRVAIDINLTEVLKVPAGQATLPNGTMIPVDTMGAGVIEIPVSGINGKVYVSYNNDVALVGFAFAIKQLDYIGRDVGTIGIFPRFNVSNMSVTAGIFSSPSTGQNGVAVFGNIAGIWGSNGDLASSMEAFQSIEQSNPRWKERLMGKRLLRIKNTQQVLDIAKEK